MTVIECLVAIFVIAVLMGLLMPPTSGRVRVAARRAQAQNDMMQIITAINAFTADNDVYPVAPGRSGQLVYGCPGSVRHNSEVINILRADTVDPLPGGGSPMSVNRRGVVYLDVPNIRDPLHPRCGLGTGKETNTDGVTIPGEWYDPWGSPYLIFINTRDIGPCRLGMVYSDLALATPPPPGVKADVAAATLGKDRQIGTGGNGVYAESDDQIALDR